MKKGPRRPSSSSSYTPRSSSAWPETRHGEKVPSRRPFNKDAQDRNERQDGERRPSFGKKFGDKPRGPRGAASGPSSNKGPRRFERKFDRNEEQATEHRPKRFAGKPHQDRPSRHERSERPERSEWRERPARPERNERPARQERSEHRPSRGKDFKPRATSGSPGKGHFQPRRESLNRKGILLWGLHAVREALLNPQRNCYRLWATETAFSAIEDTLEKAKRNGLTRPEARRAEKGEIEHFLPPGTVHQGLVLEADPLKEVTLDDFLGADDGADLVIVLDQVTDPHNIGAILRSAAAFGARAVIVTERNAPGATGTMAKTACGAMEHVALIPVVNIARTLTALKEENYWCVGLAEEGDHDMAASKLQTGRVALVMGAEGEGLRRLTREHCDELARLPTGGAIGSLNVSNAAAIALYELVRQRVVAGPESSS